MSKIHRLPNVATAEQEASDWIARLHADDVTAEDLARFEAWRTAHARHALAYEAMSLTLDEVKHAGHIVRAVSFGNAMHAAGSGVHTARRSLRLGLAAAAVIVVLTFMSVWWTTREGPQTLFQTAIGEHASVELPDGSRLDLNSNSAARVEYSERVRTIRLTRGEAFFKVAHEPQRPFWVMAGDSWIRAVGTAFNVDMRPSSVRVIVSEGTVKLARTNAGNRTPSDALLALAPVSVLTAGQQADIQSGAAKIDAVSALETTRLTAWRQGKVYFENQNLEAVVEELGRYTKYRITIEDAALRQLPVGGTFQANTQGVDTLLSMLRDGFGLHIRRESGDRIYIENAAPTQN